jgi:hypothetical protein
VTISRSGIHRVKFSRGAREVHAAFGLRANFQLKNLKLET